MNAAALRDGMPLSGIEYQSKRISENSTEGQRALKIASKEKVLAAIVFSIA